MRISPKSGVAFLALHCNQQLPFPSFVFRASLTRQIASTSSSLRITLDRSPSNINKRSISYVFGSDQKNGTWRPKDGVRFASTNIEGSTGQISSSFYERLLSPRCPRLTKSGLEHLGKPVYDAQQKRSELQIPKLEASRNKIRKEIAKAEAAPTKPLKLPKLEPIDPFSLPPSKISTTGKTVSEDVELWSYTHQTTPDGDQVQVYYTADSKEANDLVHLLQGKVLGFDMEWTPSFIKTCKSKVSLIQLCDPHTILLFHIDKMTTFPPTLAQVIGNPDVLKCGVSISNDGKRLKGAYSINCRGLLELSNLAIKADPKRWASNGARMIAMTKLCEIYLGKPLPKGPVRMSNWSKELSLEQMHYAANDAYAGLRLFEELDLLRNSCDPVPDLPATFELVETEESKAEESKAEAPQPKVDFASLEVQEAMFLDEYLTQSSKHV